MLIPQCVVYAPILGRMLFQAGSLLLVIISVYLLKRIHIFSDKSYKVVQGLVFNLTLPCAIIMSFATNKHPMNLLWLVVFGLFACLIPLFVVYFGSRGDEPRYRAYQMLNASGLNIGAFCLPVVQTFMGPSAGLPVIMLDIGNAIIATAASLTITRSLLHLGSPAKDLPLSLKIKNIAHDFYSSISFDCYMLMRYSCLPGGASHIGSSRSSRRSPMPTRSLQWP